MPTLQELLNAAYSSSGAKVASATRQSESQDFIAKSLGMDSTPSTPAAQTKVAQKHSEETCLADMDYAEKIAQALERSAVLVTKLASEQPVVVDPPNKQVASHPKPPPTAHGNADGTGKDEKSQGLPGGVQTDSNSSTHKQAAMAMVRSKLAQAEQLMESGQRELAQHVMAEADQLAKTAGFSIAPANLPGHSTDFMLGTSMAHTPHAPTNEGAISLTKAQARDKTTAEAKEHLKERPTKDNIPAAALGSAASQAGGVKTAALLRQKVAAGALQRTLDAGREQGVGFDPRSGEVSLLPAVPFGAPIVGAMRARAADESGVVGALKGIGGGFVGAGVGSLPGYVLRAVGEHADSPVIAGIGKGLSYLGSAGGAVLGTDMATRGALERAKAKGQSSAAAEEGLEVPEKQASAAELIETKNFLEKVAAFAAADEATDEDRAAAEILIHTANTQGLGAVHAALSENG